MNAIEYGQVLRLAFCMREVSTNTASRVLLPFLKPNCSGPSRPLASAAAVIFPHILTVTRRNKFDGTVIGLY